MRGAPWLAALLVGCAAAPTVRTEPSWVPVDLHHGRYAFVRGTLNGHPTDMVIDTGAGATVVDLGFARRVGLTLEGQGTATGVGGSVTAHRAPGVRLRIGATEASGVNAVVLDMGFVDSVLGRPMPVIVGVDVLNELVLDLDYPNRRVAFRGREFAYRGDGDTLPLSPVAGEQHPRWKLPFELSGAGETVRGWAQLDTGSGDSLDLASGFGQRHRLLDRVTRQSEWLSAGVGGFATERTFSWPQLHLGRFRVQDVPMSLQEKIGIFRDERYDGNMGVKVLGRFRVICDFPRRRLHLEPGPGYDTRAFTRDRLGIFPESRPEGLFVKLVAPGSPAATAGIAAGEKITAVDGATGTAAQLLDLMREAGRRRGLVRIRTGDREVMVRMRRYYAP